jgi:hypothetical protein
VAVQATDSDGTVSRVDFYVNDAMVSSDTSAPYGAVFSSATPGSYAVKAVTTDDDGASSEIFSSFTLVDMTDPDPLSLTITNPANGIEFETGEVVSLSATATGPDAITSIDFSIDGSKLGSGDNVYQAKCGLKAKTQLRVKTNGMFGLFQQTVSNF